MCPFKADAAVDYSGDYGCNVHPPYEDSDHPTPATTSGSRATPERSKYTDNVMPKKSAPARSKSSMAAVKPPPESTTSQRPAAAPSFLGDITKKAALKSTTSNSSSTTTQSPAGNNKKKKPLLLAEIQQGAKKPPPNLLSAIAHRGGKLRNSTNQKPVAPTTPQRQLLQQITPDKVEGLQEAPCLFKQTSPNKKNETTTKTRAPKQQEEVAVEEEEEIVEEVLVEKTPEEKRAERTVQLEQHYADDARALKDAQRHCDMLENGLDLFHAAMVEWVGWMVDHPKDEGLSSAQKQEQVDSFAELCVDLEPLAVALEERSKWVARSWMECCLARDLYRSLSIAFNFMRNRTKSLGATDKVAKKKRKEIGESLNVVHSKNLKTFEQLGKPPAPTRHIPNVAQLIRQKMQPDKKSGKTVKRVVVRKVKKKVTAPESTSAAPNNSRDPEQVPEQVPEQQAPVVQLSVQEVAGRDQLKWQLMRQLEATRKMQHKLEKAITNAGLSIPDEKISYHEAKEKMAEITKRMQEIGHRDPEYFTLEQQMEKYHSALMASDEHKRDMEQQEEQWEKDVAAGNLQALKQLRRHMPVHIRSLSEAELTSNPTPNGKTLPMVMAKKFKRTAALQLIRRSPQDIEKLHFANLEGMSLSGLTLTENRALYEHIRSVGPKWEKGRADKSIERKYMWYLVVRNKVKSGLLQQQKNNSSQRSSSSTSVMDYCGDYGYPDGPVYEQVEVTKEDLENLTAKAKEDARRAIEERTQFWNERT